MTQCELWFIGGCHSSMADWDFNRTTEKGTHNFTLRTKPGFFSPTTQLLIPLFPHATKTVIDRLFQKQLSTPTVCFCNPPPPPQFAVILLYSPLCVVFVCCVSAFVLFMSSYNFFSSSSDKFSPPTRKTTQSSSFGLQQWTAPWTSPSGRTSSWTSGRRSWSPSTTTLTPSSTSC